MSLYPTQGLRALNSRLESAKEEEEDSRLHTRELDHLGLAIPAHGCFSCQVVAHVLKVLQQVIVPWVEDGWRIGGGGWRRVEDRMGGGG